MEIVIRIKPRDTQTRVKHEILSRYLDTWGGIIVSGLLGTHFGRRPSQEWSFVYIDCFSSLGRYIGEKEDIFQNREPQVIYGSSVIGIRALDKLVNHAQKMGVNVKANSVLIEKEKAIYQELRETLRLAGYGDRIRETKEFSSLTNGQIATVNADSITIVGELLEYTTQPNKWAFYLIDPYGPSGIPYDFVKKVVSQEKHDVMINFIYEDLLRKTGMCLRENLTPQLLQLIDNWTKAFGSDRWKEIVRETLLAEEEGRDLRETLGEYGKGIVLSIEEIRELKEQKFVEAYRDVLHSMDSSLVTKLVNLRFGDKERTMFYLYLTTHDPTGALSLNKILYDAKYLEHELRYRLQIAKRTAPPPGQLMLLPVEEVKVPLHHNAPRPTNEKIGQTVMKYFSGKQATKKDVYKELADTIYFPNEVDKAIRYLRRQGLANFEGNLRHKTLIEFDKK